MGDPRLFKRPASLAEPSATTRPMRQELQAALLAAQSVPPEQLPQLFGDLAEIQATVLARLAVPVQVAAATDELVDIAEASRRLSISRSFLYRHTCRLAFSRRVGRRLLFSSRGIDHYQDSAITPRL